jgi:hypothetical protein
LPFYSRLPEPSCKTLRGGSGFLRGELFAVGGETSQMTVNLVLEPMMCAGNYLDVARELFRFFQPGNRPA